MKIGVLGLGSIGLRHLNNIKSLGHEVQFHDPNPAGGGFVYSVPRDLLIRDSDAIVVASPSKCHAHDLMDAVRAGKHVLVEKPFGYDCPPLLDGFMQATRAKNPNLIIATGFNLRFHHSVMAAKRTLESGMIGHPVAAGFTVNQKTTKPPYLMDGILRNWCSHEIDLAHHLLGDGHVVNCTIDPDEDGRDTKSAIIFMKFKNIKDKVFIQADYFSDPEQRYFWIEGDKGSLYVNLVQRQTYIRFNGKDPQMWHSATDNWDQNYLEEMRLFIASIAQGKHLAPLATGEDGVRALYTVMEAREKVGLEG